MTNRNAGLLAGIILVLIALSAIIGYREGWHSATEPKPSIRYNQPEPSAAVTIRVDSLGVWAMGIKQGPFIVNGPMDHERLSGVIVIRKIAP